MVLDDGYWEKYLEELKNKILEIINDKDIGSEIYIELLDLYNVLDNKKLPLKLRKQKAVLIEYYLGISRDIINRNKKKR